MKLRDTVIQMNLEGKTDEEIAQAVGKSVFTIRYYINRYSEQPNRRRKYSVKFMQSVARSCESASGAEVARMLKLSPTTIYRILQKVEDLNELRARLELRGWFDPLKTDHCLAVGLERAEVVKSTKYLKTLDMTVSIIDDVPNLVHHGAFKRTRFPLNFLAEIVLLTNPKTFLHNNTVLIRNGWIDYPRNVSPPTHPPYEHPKCARCDAGIKVRELLGAQG